LRSGCVRIAVLIFLLCYFEIVTPKFLVKNTKYAVLAITVCGDCDADAGCADDAAGDGRDARALFSGRGNIMGGAAEPGEAAAATTAAQGA